MHLWQSTGYGTIVYFAAIMGIDRGMFEAAAIDGASAWQRIRYIILPSLKPIFVILLLFALGGIMHGNFGLFWNLVGNNAALFQSTDIIETAVYRMVMSQNNFTTSTAVGLYQSHIRIRHRDHGELDRPEDEPRLCTLLISPTCR